MARHRRRQWHPTPVLLPGKSQGRGSLVGCRLWGHTGLDTTEATWQQHGQTLFFVLYVYIYLFNSSINPAAWLLLLALFYDEQTEAQTYRVWLRKVHRKHSVII